MLGENHALNLEFPEYSDLIAHIRQQDDQFAKDMARYNQLDRQIRTLETNDTPTSDANMVALKAERLQLKDQLYQILQAQSS